MRPRRLWMIPSLALGLIAAGGWFGCQADPLDQDLPAEKMGSGSVVFFLPDYRLDELGAEILADLEAVDAAHLDVAIPEISGVLSSGGSFHLDPTAFTLPLSRVSVSSGQGGLVISLVLDAGSGNGDIIFSDEGQTAYSCRAGLIVPMRQTEFLTELADDAAGLPALMASGVPGLEGSPATIVLDDHCPIQSPAALTGLTEALEEAVQSGLEDLTDTLAAQCGARIGAEAGCREQLSPNLAMQLLPDPAGSALAGGESRLSLAGGFQFQRASCMPADLPGVEPVHAPAVAFEQVLPNSREPYGLALGVSLDYLRQAARAVYGAGLLCRQVGQGVLPGVDLAALLPSLTDLGAPASVRVAVWPRGEMSLEFTQPQPDQGENLPRLKLMVSDLYVDVYGTLDGADLRVLGLGADLTVYLGFRLDEGQLWAWLADVQVTRLEILFDALLAEKAGTLRTAASEALRQVIAAWVDTVGPVPLDLPPGAASGLRELRLGAEHLILYF